MSKRWSLSTRIGRGDNLSHIKQREGTYRSGGAWGDVEEGHPILGALRNGKVFWDCVKRLQMYQHLVCLVDAGKEEAVSHKSPHSPPCCPSQCRASTHSTPYVLGAHLHQESFKRNAVIPYPSANCVLKGLQCRSIIHTEDDQSWKWSARGGICWVVTLARKQLWPTSTSPQRHMWCVSVFAAPSVTTQLHGCAIRTHDIHGMAVRGKVCIPGSGCRSSNTITLKHSYKLDHRPIGVFSLAQLQAHAPSSEHIPFEPWIRTATCKPLILTCQGRNYLVTLESAGHGPAHLCKVFQKRRMTVVRYRLVIGFLMVQLMSCKMS